MPTRLVDPSGYGPAVPTGQVLREPRQRRVDPPAAQLYADPRRRSARGARRQPRPRPDALVTTSGQLALGALHTAAQAGLAVPDELAVTGWDDTDAADPPA